MASIKPTKNGYRAQIYVLGVRESATYRTRREAAAWAASRETEIRTQRLKPPGERYTLADALIRYRDEVSPGKRGGRWEALRIDAFLRAPLPLSQGIGSIVPDDLEAWRKYRLGGVSPGTVLREIALLSAVFEEARKAWKWTLSNPIGDMRKPASPGHREVVITRAQIKVLLRQLNYSPRRPILTTTQSIAAAFLLALRSGMRAGELCKLEWSRVHGSHCVLPVTKTRPRNVPLTDKAMRIVDKMRGYHAVKVFDLKPGSMDTMFRRARDKAGLIGFTFHDSRHTAATWLAQHVHVMDLCKMFGWSTTQYAMIYYNPTAADIAQRINAGQGKVRTGKK